MNPLTPDLSSWRSVSLEAMNHRAALLDRDEHKYVLTEPALVEAIGALVDDFDVLTIEGTNVFTYDTVYFDTSDLLCYRQHQQGRRRRMKVRSRRYVDSDECWFEVKLKGRRGRTIKERMRYRPDDHGVVTDRAMSFLDACLRRHYDDEVAEPFAPALAMTYRRLTLVGRASPERVTIDVGLEFRAGDVVGDSPSDTVIVEVKSPDGHGRADAVFHAAGIRSESCSKYCVGLNLVRDDLTYNPFNATLRRHFDWHGRAER